MAYASTEVGPFEWSYTERDVILYNLSVGCTWRQQRYVYENSSQFAPLPTLAVIPPYHDVIPSVPLGNVLPKYNPVNTPVPSQWHVRTALGSVRRSALLPKLLQATGVLGCAAISQPAFTTAGTAAPWGAVPGDACPPTGLWQADNDCKGSGYTRQGEGGRGSHPHRVQVLRFDLLDGLDDAGL